MIEIQLAVPEELTLVLQAEQASLLKEGLSWGQILRIQMQLTPSI